MIKEKIEKEILHLVFFQDERNKKKITKQIKEKFSVTVKDRYLYYVIGESLKKIEQLVNSSSFSFSNTKKDLITNYKNDDENLVIEEVKKEVDLKPEVEEIERPIFVKKEEIKKEIEEIDSAKVKAKNTLTKSHGDVNLLNDTEIYIKKCKYSLSEVNIDGRMFQFDKGYQIYYSSDNQVDEFLTWYAIFLERFAFFAYMNQIADAEDEIEQELSNLGIKQGKYGSRFCLPMLIKNRELSYYADSDTSKYFQCPLEEIELIREYKKGSATKIYLNNVLTELWENEYKRKISNEEFDKCVEDALSEWSRPISKVRTRSDDYGLTTLMLNPSTSEFDAEYIKNNIKTKKELSKYIESLNDFEYMEGYKRKYFIKVDNEHYEQCYSHIEDLKPSFVELSISSAVSNGEKYFLCTRKMQDIMWDMNFFILKYNVGILDERVELIKNKLEEYTAK